MASRDDNSLSSSIEFADGNYSGAINAEFHTTVLLESLPNIAAIISGSDAKLIAGGRNRNVHVTIGNGPDTLSVLVKSFGRQSALKDWFDLHGRNSKAQRSFEAALHLQHQNVATPEPIAFVERRQGSRLLESYYLSVFQDSTVSFNQALLHLLHKQGTSSEFMALLNDVALQCRTMHDAGFLHFDLGNQNILLQASSDRRWTTCGIIDLNRGRLVSEVTLQQRGQDLARLNIPSNLMLMFLDMYWGSPAPVPLLKSVRRHQARFRRRQQTRNLRHPIREARIERESRALPATDFFPSPRDIWIWDDTSDQALAALDRRERSQQYPAGRSGKMFFDTLAALPVVWREYKRAKATAFSDGIALAGRVAIALEPDQQSLEQELELLDGLGTIPVLVRFNHHESASKRVFQQQLVKQLCSSGRKVTAAFVQDRQAVLEPGAWHSFILSTLEEIGTDLEAIEFGHAVNRVKWGIWSFPELHRFYGCLEHIARTYPGLDILGPATIDFEYPFLISALKQWPQSVPMAAMSHHLYVDRRGAPENEQNGFSALEKFALAKSVAKTTGRGVERVVVSEVNWPLLGTGIHSPVTTPFAYRNADPASLHDSGVDEETYAAFMLRYLALALCSGLVDRVYWWRLVAPGYGLIDRDETGVLRLRPAYHALKHFISLLADAEVSSAAWPQQVKDNHGEYRVLLQRQNGERLAMCWRHGPDADFPEDLLGESFQDCYGNELESRPVTLKGSPIYVRHCKVVIDADS
ncbi:MAG: lipopolysaccharide kinase InaA family protein [Pseudomonadales bacterium]|nr:lipopolysaccharide kinase InaA family protein [Pseudomonadales bacterium]